VGKFYREVIRMPLAPRVARVTEIIASSPKGFDDAVKVGFARATRTLRGVTGMRMVDFRVAVENSKIVEYRVRMEVIFVLET
jgi:dodecin